MVVVGVIILLVSTPGVAFLSEKYPLNLIGKGSLSEFKAYLRREATSLHVFCKVAFIYEVIFFYGVI